MRLSIALATYQGQPYLAQQLQSLARQTRTPDELVVCDDLSSDDTVQIVEDFRRRAPFEVRLERNPARLGVSANFEKAISLCGGDVIFPCDQDDVWLPHKLAQMEPAFSDDRVGLAFGDLEIVREDLAPMGYTAFDALGLSGGLRALVEAGRTFEALLRHNFISGAACAFRSRYKSLICPIPSCWVHDEWLALMIAAVSQVRLLPIVVAKYRQHSRQEIGLVSSTLWGQLRRGLMMGKPYFRKMVVRTEAAHDRLAQHAQMLRDPRDLALLDRCLEHARVRLRLRQNLLLRWPLALRVWSSGDYSRFGYGWKSGMQDLFLP